MLRGWVTATVGFQRGYALCPPLSTVIHRKEKVAKRKEERPTTAFFFSSNDNGNDHLKSGQLWSEGLGAPQAGGMALLLLISVWRGTCDGIV